MKKLKVLTVVGTRPEIIRLSRVHWENWKTHIELANAIFEYFEIFHNRQRRHSKLGYRTPIEFELTYEKSSIPA